jgi:hypothetical protein
MSRGYLSVSGNKSWGFKIGRKSDLLWGLLGQISSNALNPLASQKSVLKRLRMAYL